MRLTSKTRHPSLNSVHPVSPVQKLQTLAAWRVLDEARQKESLDVAKLLLEKTLSAFFSNYPLERRPELLLIHLFRRLRGPATIVHSDCADADPDFGRPFAGILHYCRCAAL